MTILRKTSSFVVAALLVGFFLSACGDKESAGGEGVSAPAKADSKTLTEANFAQVLASSQSKAKSAHVDMTVGMGGQSVKAQGDVAIGSGPADSAMTMTMDMGSSMSFDMRMVEQVLYMNMGQMSGGKYVKIDLTDKSNPVTKQLGQVMDQMDPARQMADLQKAVTSLEKKGAAKTIDGVKARPYVVTVDTSKIQSLKELPQSSAGAIPDTIVYTMYVGPDDLLRRMSFEIAGSELTIDYSKWGEPVDIKAPSADEVSDEDISQLMGGFAPA